MQREISNKIQLGETLNPLNNISAVLSIDNTSNLKDVFGKVDKLGDLWDKGTADASLKRYIPDLSNVLRQGKIFNIVPKKAYITSTYSNKKTLKFTIELAANTHTNYSSMCIVFPIQIKKSADKTTNVNMITANKIFCHWLKEIDARRYPEEVRILPTNNTVKIYQYAAQQLKHLPSKSLDDIRELLLYEKKAVVLTGGRYRRSNTSTIPADRMNSNLGERVTDFLALIGKKMYYRIPLGFFTFLDLVNFPHKIDTQFLFTLENNINILFETKTKADVPNEPDTQIIFHDMRYISYPQITLDDNFLAYFNGIIRSRGTLRTGVISSPYQQSFEINTKTQSLKVNFHGLNKQTEWLEISFVFDKSDQHQTVSIATM